MKKVLSIVVGASVMALCLGWGGSTPTILAGGNNDQVQAKVSAGSGGEFFMSCFDNAAGGYDVRAGRFKASGAPMWSTLVADRSYSSTVDYSSWLCANNQFAVAYNDDRSGADLISCSLLSSSGAILWTTTMPITAGAYVANPKVCQDPFDGAVYCSWFQSPSSKLMKLDAATGTLLWTTPINIQDGTAQTTNADLWPAADATGGVMVSCVRQVGFTGAKTLKAFRVSPTGAAVWTGVVFSTGSLQIGNYPPCLAVPGIGYVFCWYTSSPLQCSVQVLGLDGVAKFGTNGATVASTTTNERVSPTFAVDVAGNQIYVVFPEHVPNSSIYGVSAQAFALNGTGTRLWGNSGMALQEMGTVYSTDFTAVTASGGGATFAWHSSASAVSDTLWTRRLNADRSDAWTSGAVIAAPASDKAKMVSARQANASLFIWGEGSFGVQDVAAQRVSDDGTIGGDPTVPGDINGDGSVDGLDLTAVLAAWATNDAAADINGDGTVDGLDLTIVLAAWG